MQKTLFLTLLAILTVSTSALADIKVKSRVTMSGQSYESASYIKGKRQRTEMMNGAMTTITQCDMKRSLQLYPQTKTYMVNPFDDGVVTKSEKPTETKSVKTETTKGGLVTTTTTIKDTGERKQMFGYTARHLIMTMETESSPDACNKTNTKMETDGWYIDFANDFSCQTTPANYQNPVSQKPGGCQDRYQMKSIGTAKRGYPVIEKMTMLDENGKPSTTMNTEVLEISKATLEDSLFDVPADYRQVKDASEMYASAANSGSNYGSSSSSYGDGRSSSSGISQNVQNLSKSNSSAPSNVGAKKEGTVRIGIAGVKTGAVGEGLNAAELSAAVQNTLGEYLKGTKVELVPLEAKLASAQETEAKEKQCDFILQATVSHKKGGGGFGGFGKMLGSVVSQTGIGHTGSTAGNIAGQIATQTIVAATLSQNVKAKDELTLDVKLVSTADNSSPLAKQFKQKAKSNGDDIISPVIEQAAQAIIDAVRK